MTDSRAGNAGSGLQSENDPLSPEHLAVIEDRFQAAWTGAASTPFIVEAPIDPALREMAINVAQRLSISILFSRCPTLAVWAVLTPLVEHYGGGNIDVYPHIERFLCKDFSDNAARNDLKARYRRAARGLGIPVSGNEPTELFFAPLGPVLQKHDSQAEAFIHMALVNGPPAVEDTPSARHWQRRALFLRCPGQTRLRETIAFDKSAHCARRFEAWRQGADPINDNEASLFEAYTNRMRQVGRRGSDIVGPPAVFWSGDRLALQAEKSRKRQSIRTGAFPVQMKGGAVMSIDPPWAESIPWSCGDREQDVEFAPREEEVLLFDAVSGVLLARAAIGSQEVEVSADRMVVLAARGFSTQSFGEALEARDQGFRVAWISRGETLSFEDGRTVSIVVPREATIWVDGTTLARDGSRGLLCCDGALVLSINAEIGGADRIIRARFGELVRYANVTVMANGQARVPFSAFGLDAPGDPARVRFEVLAPGAAGDLDARSELTAASWIWPGMEMPEDGWEALPRPANYLPGRSTGLVDEGIRLRVDLETGSDRAILGIGDAENAREFALVNCGERLWRYEVDSKTRQPVPRGERLVFGHVARHDSLIVQSSDMAADLLVLGNEQRTPFRSRTQVEIGPEMLEAAGDHDDRIALRRADGRILVLARLRRVRDLSDLEVVEEPDEVRLNLAPQERLDALRVVIEDASGHRRVGARAFGRRPVDAPLPSGVDVQSDLMTNAVSVRFARRPGALPARATLEIREVDQFRFEPLRDSALVQIAVGLPGVVDAPGKTHLGTLAHLLAEPEPAALEGQVTRALEPAYREAFEALGVARMVGAVEPALNAVRADGGPPRHDIVGIAPWVFERPPHAFLRLKPGSYLAGLARMADMPAPADPADPRGDQPLGIWLDRVSGDATLPSELGPEVLTQGFRALRNRLSDTDLGVLREAGTIGTAVDLICSAYTAEIDALRVFDAGGGGDPFPARLAAAVECFARAAALGEAEAHVNDLVFRTGLSRGEAGQAVTMMIRAGCEFFVYFRALWAHAGEFHDGS